jgi:cysteinyl-tRNA synthetase
VLRVFNDLTHRLEPLESRPGEPLTMYVCGPTVYDLAHLGHGKCYVSWDIVHRYLEYRGHRVVLARNYTDIDDKIIRRAQERGMAWDRLAEEFIREFERDMAALRVLPPDLTPRATEHVPDMIAHIQGLIDRGHAYVVDGDVYFAVETFPTYGTLSGRTLESMQAGARVEVDDRKRYPLDFALWKASKPGEPAWESPWGLGRPGWHIECSAMVRKHLGDTLDIHTGGLDLTFPHHENEIAQSECLTGHRFARYWLHNGFVTVQSEKMGKSLGNMSTLRDVLATYGASAVRYFLLLVHYRQEVDFSDEGLRAAGAGLGRLVKTLARFRSRLGPVTAGVEACIAEVQAAFTAAMDEDFNTARAIAVFHEALRSLAALEGADAEAAGHLVAELDRLGDVLGLDLAEPVVSQDLEDLEDGLLAIAATHDLTPSGAQEALEALVARRAAAKAAREWAVADGIRLALRDLGISLMDRPGGETAWERVEPAGRLS